MNSSFSIKEAFSYGWETFKKQWKFLVPYFTIIIITQGIISYLGGEKSPFIPLISLIVNLVGTILIIFLSAGSIKTIIMIYNNKNVSIAQNLFATQKETWKFFKVSLAMMVYLFPLLFPLALIKLSLLLSTPADSIVTFLLAGFGGIILIIVFPIIILILLGILFSTYISFDHDFGIFESVKYSQKITKGRRSKIFLFLLASGLIVILGMICLFVGLIIAIPVVSLATVYVYKKLDAQYRATHGETNENTTTVHVHTETISDTEIDSATGLAHSQTIEEVVTSTESTEEK